MTYFGLDPGLSCVIDKYCHAAGANSDIRLMLREHNVTTLVEFLDFDRTDVLSLSRINNNQVEVLLTKPQVARIMQAIGFYEFMCENGDQALADDP